MICSEFRQLCVQPLHTISRKVMPYNFQGNDSLTIDQDCPVISTHIDIPIFPTEQKKSFELKMADCYKYQPWTVTIELFKDFFYEKWEAAIQGGLYYDLNTPFHLLTW